MRRTKKALVSAYTSGHRTAWSRYGYSPGSGARTAYLFSHVILAVRRFLSARHHDLFVIASVGTPAARLLPVTQARPADGNPSDLSPHKLRWHRTVVLSAIDLLIWLSLFQLLVGCEKRRGVQPCLMRCERPAAQSTVRICYGTSLWRNLRKPPQTG
jgi:hypothetical protein